MKSRVAFAFVGAVLCLRCGSFGSDESTPTVVSEAGATSSSSGTSGGPPNADAASAELEAGVDGVSFVPIPDGTDCGTLSAPNLGISTGTKSDDGIPTTTVDAYSYAALTSTASYCAHVYIVKANDVTGVLVGIYSSDPSGPLPAKLLTSAYLAQVKTGWYSAPLAQGIRATPGTRLWVGLVPDKSDITISIDKQDCPPEGGGRHSNPSGATKDSPAKLPGDWQPSADANANACNPLLYLSP